MVVIVRVPKVLVVGGGAVVVFKKLVELSVGRVIRLELSDVVSERLAVSVGMVTIEESDPVVVLDVLCQISFFPSDDEQLSTYVKLPLVIVMVTVGVTVVVEVHEVVVAFWVVVDPGSEVEELLPSELEDGLPYGG